MTNLEQIESEPLKEVLGEILEGQKLIQKQLEEVDSKLEELEVEVKAWGSWLRNASFFFLLPRFIERIHYLFLNFAGESMSQIPEAIFG